MVGKVAAGFVLLALAAVAIVREETRLFETTLDVHQLARDLGARRNEVVTVDEALRGKSISIAGEIPSDLATWRAILGSYGIELASEDVEGRAVMHLYLQRGFPGSFTLCLLPRFFDERASDPTVTVLYHPRRADGQAISTALRARITRDPLRRGSTTFVHVSGLLVITERRSAANLYLRIARDLDALPGIACLRRALSPASAPTGSPQGAAARRGPPGLR